MSQPFTKTFQVRWSEDNALGQMDLAGYFRYVIETAWEWGTTKGLGTEESAQLGLAWVIRETEVRIFKHLNPNEKFELSIWLVKWRRVRGTRCFELRLKDSNEIIAQGIQQIVSLDNKTMRPTPPPVHLMERFLIENPVVFEQGQFPKSQVHHDGTFLLQRKVEWRDIDSLEHVNNAIYAAFAEDAVIQALADLGWSPLQLKARNLAVVVRRIHIKYLVPAVWGDRLDVTASLESLNSAGCEWYIAIVRQSDGAQILQCAIEISMVDRANGAEQKFPDSLYHALKLKSDVVERE